MSNIYQSTFVQNLLDAFHAEFPAFSFGLEEADGEFCILLPASFKSMPPLEQIAVGAGIDQLMRTLTGAGIRASLRVTNVL